MPQRRLSSRSSKSYVLNLNKGLNLYARPQDLPEGYLLEAENVVPLSPLGLQTAGAPSLVATGVNATKDLMSWWTPAAANSIITRTATAAYASGVALLVGAAQITAANKNQMCTFRGKVIFGDAGSYPVSYDGTTVTQLTTAPKAGLCANYKNRLWLGYDTTADIASYTHTIPINAIGIPVSGYGLIGYPASGSSTTADADFGTQPLGVATAPHTFVCFNMGPGEVKVTSIGISGLDYKITQMPNLPATVPAGGSISFLVNCTPDAKGVREGVVTVQTDSHIADSGAAWTSSSTTVTVALSDAAGWVADQWNNNYYWRDPDQMTTSYKITDSAAEATHTLTVAAAPSPTSGSKWEIRHKGSLSFTLTCTGTDRVMQPSPPFLDFAQLIKQATGGTDGLELTMTLTNVTSDTQTISKPSISGNTSGFTTTVTYYKRPSESSGAWVTYATWASGTKDIKPGESIVLKIKGYTETAGDLRASMTLARAGPINKNRVWFSGLNDETSYNPDQDWFDIKDDQGIAGEITALIPFNDALWITKEASCWVITGSGVSSFGKHEVTLLRGIGLCNAQAWTYGMGMLFGVGKTGVWQANGPEIGIISEPIRPTVEAWTDTHFTNMRLGFARDTLFVSNGVSTWYYHVPTEAWTTSSTLAVSAFANEAGGASLNTVLFAEAVDGKQYRWGQTTSTSKICTTWDHRAYSIKTGFDTLRSPAIVKLLRRILISHSDMGTSAYWSGYGTWSVSRIGGDTVRYKIEPYVNPGWTVNALAGYTFTYAGTSYTVASNTSSYALTQTFLLEPPDPSPVIAYIAISTGVAATSTLTVKALSDLVAAQTGTALGVNTQATPQTQEWVFPPNTIGSLFQVQLSGTGAGKATLNSLALLYNHMTEMLVL